jgi:hypothetical protein
MTFSRLKGNRRFGRYDYSFRDRRGFPSAMYEEGAAYTNKMRHWSTAAE